MKVQIPQTFSLNVRLFIIVLNSNIKRSFQILFYFILKTFFHITIVIRHIFNHIQLKYIPRLFNAVSQSPHQVPRKIKSSSIITAQIRTVQQINLIGLRDDDGSVKDEDGIDDIEGASEDIGDNIADENDYNETYEKTQPS